jgi:hypothetical protein
LRVDEAFLTVDPPGQQSSRTQPSGKKKGSGKKVSGKKDNGKKASGKANAEASEGTADASEFSFTNFIQAANTLAESMKEKREYFLALVSTS